MKTQLIILAGLALGSISHGQTCNTLDREVKITPIVFRQAKVGYQDILSRCSNSISDLKITLRKANTLARMGKLIKASSELIEGLEEKIASTPVWGGVDAPHAIDAIQASLDIANVLVKSTSQQSPSLGQDLVGQIRYSTMTQLYKVIFDAYEQLDMPYFVNSRNHCESRRCDHDDYDMLPSEYYNGIARLASSFIELQKRMGPMQASDMIELSMTQVSVKAAKNILLNSLFRRGFSCTITKLHNIEVDIHEYMHCRNEMPLQWFVEQVRAELQQIRIETRRCGN